MPGDRITYAPADVRFALWSFLWASATLFSFISNPGWFVFLASSLATPTGLGELAVPVLALLAVCFPGTMPLLLVLALAQIAEVIAILPEVANHRLILALGNAALVAAIFDAGRHETTLRPSAAAVGARFFPVARGLLLIVYAFAFFAKLNGDFLDPEMSCAGQFYGKIVGWIPALPAGGVVTEALAWATLATEGALPALLVVPRLRKAGVVLGLVFHLALAFDLLQNLVNFSTVMTALLVPFVPEQGFARLAGRWAKRAPRSMRPRAVAFLAGGAFLGIVGLAFGAVGSDVFAVPYYVLRQVVFLLLIGATLAAVLVFAESPAREPARTFPGFPMAWVVLGVALVNGLSPYLGLKTRTSFNMYSNLRVESGGSNHWLVPRSLDVLGILSDTVAVLRTNDPDLASHAGKAGSRITWFEFSSYVNQRAGIEVWYERDGTVRHLSAATGDGVPPAPPWLLRKLLFFRPVGSSVGRECLW